MKTPHPHSQIIDDLDGTTAVARIFKIAPQAVSQWRTSGIPDSRLMCLKLLRPDLFHEEKKVA